MKMNKNILVSFLLMIVVASLYRVIPRPVNFAPQIAMALFAGAVIKDKVWAFALPIFSMVLSDLLYQILYVNGLTAIPGFYEGQWQNYILFAAMTSIGFLIKKIRVLNVLIASVAAPTVFFFISNFVVWSGWQGTRGLNRPKTFEGLLMCYNDALPFYANSVMACCFFSAIFFGTYMLIRRKQPQPAVAQEKRMWFEVE
jgi:hypothetical protein